MPALVDAIRATGAKQPIMLGGRRLRATTCGEWLANRPRDKELVAGVHNYSGQPCHTAVLGRGWSPRSRQAPVVSGEFGESGLRDRPSNAFMDWADLHGVGYLMWAWWVLPDTHCSTLTCWPTSKGPPAAPNGTALQGAPARAGAARHAGRRGTTQALDRAIEVRARCKPTCRVRATGRLLGKLKLKPVSRVLPGGRTRTLALPLPRDVRRAAARELSAGQPVAARVTIVVTADSVSSRKTRVVKLRR